MLADCKGYVRTVLSLAGDDLLHWLPGRFPGVRHRLPRPPAITPSIMIGLVCLAVGLTGLLAYRAVEASRAQHELTERTLREYAGFAAFQLKGAAMARMMGQHRQALDPVVRWINARGPTPAPGVERLAQLVKEQGATCRCLEGISFFYQVTFADSGIQSSSSSLATPDALRKIRDTVMAQVQGPSRVEPAFVNASATRPIGVPLTSQYLVTIFDDLAARPYLFTHAVSVDTSGTPLLAYGFAVPAERAVGRAVQLVLSSQPVLPSTLTGSLRIDSILTVTVRTRSRALVYRNRMVADTRYAASDSLELRQGGLQFEVAIAPAVAGQLIIGGLPRSRLPEILATAALAVSMLGLLFHQYRKQEELGRLRDEFVSGVSHELRTPLSQIRLLAELLRLGKVPTEERRDRSLRIIDQEARRLTFLVESILSFTSSPRNALSPTPTDISADVEEIVSGFEPLAAARGVRLLLQLAPGLTADVDRGALRQVLLNLLDNAVRYGPGGQTVTVTTAREGDRWTLDVTDEGPGVPAGEREAIFSPYFRLSRDMGGAVGGTGIGLAVVRRLVRAHGGEVHVYAANEVGSAVMEGARFLATMPLRMTERRTT